MTTLAISLTVAISALFAVVLFQLRRRSRRTRALRQLELRPNCLLTRFPILFIAGRRSVFHLFDYWNCVPAYLREHGYEVMILELPPRTGELRAILSALTEVEEKFHVIADAGHRAILENLAQSKHEKIISLIEVSRAGRSARISSPSKATDLKPLEQAIESFVIPELPVRRDVGEWFTGLLILAHNFLISQNRPVDGLGTAAHFTLSPWEIEKRFLNLAIELAERDSGLPN